MTNDERGRRIFQLHKERSVETAIDKIRHNPGSGLSTFSPQDIKTLNYILGETWVSGGRQIWEPSSFSRLTRKDLEEIISIGNDVNSKKLREETGVNKICGILKGSIGWGGKQDPLLCTAIFFHSIFYYSRTYADQPVR